MARNIRIIALDLDGTLLDSSKRLSGRNREALSRAAESGVHIVPTTGRFFGMMPEEIRALPFVRYAITINGAQVYDRVNDTAIVRNEIPLEMAIGIMAMLDRYDVIYDCYRGNWGWMTSALQQKAEAYVPDEHYLRLVRKFRRPVPELKGYLRQTAANGDVQKVMLFARNDDRNVAKECLAKISAEIVGRFPEVKVTSSGWNNLEINIASANKGNALGCFAKRLGYTLENCMAFGDGLNDLSMIEATGLGIAMGNAADEVKAAAQDVVAANDNDGVAKGIEKWIFSK